MYFRSQIVDNVQIVELAGSFDAYHAPEVRQWINQALERDPVNLVVNLREVSFLDSTGLSTLVQFMKRMRMTNGDLCLCELQQPVRMIFELTRLDSVFEIFSSEEEALFALNSK
jgi:anti-sigma B factor antagonist